MSGKSNLASNNSTNYNASSIAKLLEKLTIAAEQSPPPAKPKIAIEELRASAKSSILKTEVSNVLWQSVMPHFLSKDHAGVSACVVFCVDKTDASIPLASFFYSWDLPSLRHALVGDMAHLIMRTFAQEGSSDKVRLSLSYLDRVIIDSSDVPTLVDEFVQSSSEEDLKGIINPPSNYASDYYKTQWAQQSTLVGSPGVNVGIGAGAYVYTSPSTGAVGATTTTINIPTLIGGAGGGTGGITNTTGIAGSADLGSYLQDVSTEGTY